MQLEAVLVKNTRVTANQESHWQRETDPVVPDLNRKEDAIRCLSL